jgi:multidrug efflux system membrane fusion protein
MRVKHFLFLAALALVSAGVYAWYSGYPIRAMLAGAVTPPAPVTGPANAADDRADAVQVVVAPVTKADVPIYLSGIGTVLAYNTIDNKAQVDGVILSMNFKEGDDVKIGDPLIIIDPAPYQAKVAQWQATKQKAQAQLENAKINLWRDQQLLAHDFATQKTTDSEAALVSEYTADIAEDDAQIQFYQTELGFTTIRSPINGRTGIRHVDPGNLIRAADNTNIVTVVQMQPIYIIITVAARSLAQAGSSPGLSDLPVFAYAQDGVQLLDRGKVETVNNVVDPSTGTITLKASFPNERSRLWPGDFVDCRILVERRHDGITVPSAAVQHGPKGDFVWAIGPDLTARPQPVRVRQTLGDTALIDRGLDGGEKVVIDGEFHLRPGSKVTVVPELADEDAEVPNTQ